MGTLEKIEGIVRDLVRERGREGALKVVIEEIGQALGPEARRQAEVFFKGGRRMDRRYEGRVMRLWLRKGGQP